MPTLDILMNNMNNNDLTPQTSKPTDEIPSNPRIHSLRGHNNKSILWWLSSALIVLVVFIVCMSVWGSSMDFPSSISQMQENGTHKSVQISRLIAKEIKALTTWMTANWGGMFDAFDYLITYTMVYFEDLLKWIPWPDIFIAIALTAFRLGSWKLALLSLVSLSFIGMMNRWDSATETIAIIIFSVVISVTIAVPLGVCASKSNRFEALLRPVLDVMQTMPSYVYLVPGILFFGLGYTPAVLATVIYAMPPAIRLTNLGIRQVPTETVEAALSFGASPFQLLTNVQIPMALPTIMAGVNQTTMLALSMVVIASLVGASGLGEDVFRALQRQDPGNSVIAGTSIVLIAILIDRITQAATNRGQSK